MQHLLSLSMFALLCLASCQTSQPLFSYHSTPVPNDSLAQQLLIPVEPVLASGDKITMSIWGHNDLSIGSVNSVYTSNESTGKWLILDDEGQANLPQIGRTKLAGFTVKEANYFLEQQYGSILKDPIINVRVLNHFVTVLGEVNNPGRYSLNNETLRLIDLLAEADGLSAYAKNDEVEIVRIIDDQSVKLRVNLRDLSSLPSKNIALQPNDIIYVGAIEAKDTDRNLSKISLVTSIATGLAVIISVLAK